MEFRILGCVCLLTWKFTQREDQDEDGFCSDASCDESDAQVIGSLYALVLMQQSRGRDEHLTTATTCPMSFPLHLRDLATQ